MLKRLKCEYDLNGPVNTFILCPRCICCRRRSSPLQLSTSRVRFPQWRCRNRKQDGSDVLPGSSRTYQSRQHGLDNVVGETWLVPASQQLPIVLGPTIRNRLVLQGRHLHRTHGFLLRWLRVLPIRQLPGHVHFYQRQGGVVHPQISRHRILQVQR